MKRKRNSGPFATTAFGAARPCSSLRYRSGRHQVPDSAFSIYGIARKRLARVGKLAVLALVVAFSISSLGISPVAVGQAVILPAPRLLTTVPMGGQVGTQLDVTITGQYIEDVEELRFSTPHISAVAKRDSNGTPIEGEYVVTIDEACPLGIHEARVMSRLGISSPRVFSVGDAPEVVQANPATSVATAFPIAMNSVCNSKLATRAVNHFSFEAEAGQRITVDCAAKGIDSKMNPVVIIADASGADLLVERRGDILDFTPPESGKYLVKVHDLTFQGGDAYFFRLALKAVSKDAPLIRMPSTFSVNSFSWPPMGLPAQAASEEAEPNNSRQEAQLITLPCDMGGSFFPAADVDTFRFVAKKGETWWVEVGSERLGRPTDPAIVVQRVSGNGSDEVLSDVAELTDIASPIKRSSNGYSYDGPPYNAGSTDILGKVVIPEDGTYQLQIRDLFGGTRRDARNIYRLIIRQAQPDFTLVAWALHMNLRNGDRNAVSKPFALRGGTTIPIEVVAVRRDGFDGDIQLNLDGLPEGVTATGLKIPAGKTRGIVLVSASAAAPRGLTRSRFAGSATIAETQVTRRCHFATMAWPVRDAWSEIPSPRLVADLPISVGGSELAAITISPKEQKVWEVRAGEKLSIPLLHTRRGEFSGNTLNLRAFGPGMERIPAFDISLDDKESTAVIDLAKLKTPPGDYFVAFYGSAVAKYQYNPAAAATAVAIGKTLGDQLERISAEAKLTAEEAKKATAEEQASMTQKIAELSTKSKDLKQRISVNAAKIVELKKQSQPKDIVDIYVSEPISIRVQPAPSP
jgi:hypothetical protein